MLLLLQAQTTNFSDISFFVLTTHQISTAKGLNYSVFLQKVMRRLRVSRSLRRFAAGFFVHVFMPGRDGYDFTEESPEDFLESIHPDGGSSTIVARKSIIDKPPYDLQIILPVYNVEDYVEECVNSILTQETRYTFQLVIVNDGSTDTSEEKVRKFTKDPRVKLIKQENKGLSGARNAALQQLDAKYLMFVDSDDSLSPGAVEALMEAAMRYNADIVEGNYNTTIDGKSLTPHTIHKAGKIEKNRLTGFSWLKVYKSELFESIEFPISYWYQDTINAFLIFEMAKDCYGINEHIYNYRINPQGITVSSLGRPKSLDTLYVTRMVLNDAGSLGLLGSMEQLDKFLYQMVVNFLRTYPLGEKVCKAVYECSCVYYETYFSAHKALPHDSPYHNLRNALAKKDYDAYLIEVLTLI